MSKSNDSNTSGEQKRDLTGRLRDTFNALRHASLAALNSRLTQAGIIGAAVIFANEANLMAKTGVTKVSDVVSGPTFNERSKTENYRTAVHEAGHAIVILALRTELGIDIEYATIRGNSHNDGYVQPTVEPDFSGSINSLKSRIAVDYGGLAAEQIIFGENTAGVSQDLTNAANMAYHMVTSYGLSESLIPADWDSIYQRGAADQETWGLASQEISTHIIRGYHMSFEIAKLYQEQITLLADALMNDPDQTLNAKEIKALLNYDEERGLPYHDADGKLVFGSALFHHFHALADEIMAAQPATDVVDSSILQTEQPENDEYLPRF
jgi:hypothetical protein